MTEQELHEALNRVMETDARKMDDVARRLISILNEDRSNGRQLCVALTMQAAGEFALEELRKSFVSGGPSWEAAWETQLRVVREKIGKILEAVPEDH